MFGFLFRWRLSPADVYSFSFNGQNFNCLAAKYSIRHLDWKGINVAGITREEVCKTYTWHLYVAVVFKCCLYQTSVCIGVCVSDYLNSTFWEPLKDIHLVPEMWLSKRSPKGAIYCGVWFCTSVYLHAEASS